MALPPLLLQTAGSLVAIFAVAGLARWLKLGSAQMLADDDIVRRASDEVDDGFGAVAISRDAEGRAALARNASGQIMVIKRHGNRLGGRVLGPRAKARLRGDLGIADLEVDCGEARFGKVFLAIPDPQAWAAAINALRRSHDA